MGSSWRLVRLFRALLLPLALGLAGCSALPQTVFQPAGPVARIQLNLLSLSIWIVSIIFVVVFAILLYVLWRFRARPNSPKPAEIEGNHVLEIVWTVIPILILVVMAVPTIKDAFALAAPPSPDAMQVKVIGHQWWWEFQYPGLGVVTGNELHIPQGQRVDLTITSTDVIHSFWIPRLAGKMDAVPNRDNHMWFQGDETGTFYGQCAQFCGDSHANMRMRVVVDSKADFAAWVAKWQQGEVKPDAANALAVQGEKLFMGDQPCYTCHAITGSKAQGKVGPNLTLLGSRSIIAAGTLANTPEHLQEWLHDPQAVKPGALMPNLHLSDDQMKALAAFLESQK